MEFPPKLAPLPASGLPGPGPMGGTRAYFAAVAISVAAILSQYVVPYEVPGLRPLYASFAGGLAIVYGIPVVAFATLVGVRPLRRWAANPGVAVWEGIRWYALLLFLGLVLVGIMLSFYLRFDPQIVQQLAKPNPVLVGAAPDPYFWIVFAFAIGIIEETIFRGWIFNYWLVRGTPDWRVPAVASSALFAGVHLYYGTTYGIAAPLIYPQLFLMGIAFAATVRASGGNLWMAALLHGAHDSAAFLTLLSPNGALAVEYGLLGIGLLVALVDFVGTGAGRTPGPGAPPSWAAHPGRVYYDYGAPPAPWSAPTGAPPSDGGPVGPPPGPPPPPPPPSSLPPG